MGNILNTDSVGEMNIVVLGEVFSKILSEKVVKLEFD